MSERAEQTYDERVVSIYTSGPVACSVCTPADFPVDDIEEIVNRKNPTGISSRWTISDHKEFATGQPNPCVCNMDAGRVHRLLTC